MNRVVLDESLKSATQPGCYEITDPQVIDHLINHLQIKPRKKLKAIFIGESLGVVDVVSLEEGKVTLKPVIQQPAFPQRYTLLVATSRPPTMKKIIEHGTSMGVGRFIFFTGLLSEKSYLTSKVLELDEMKKLARLGLAQGANFCQDPEFIKVQTIEEAIPYVQGIPALLSLEEGQSFRILDGNIDKKPPITLAIGPERGWTMEEEEFLKAKNFIPFKLSPHTLRVEIATFAALGQLEMLYNG